MIRNRKATAPSHWAPYIVNADPSGLSEQDIEQCDKFVAWLIGTDAYMTGHTRDLGFMVRCDASQFGVLATDMTEYQAILN